MEISQKCYFFAPHRQLVNPDEREAQAVGLTLNVWVYRARISSTTRPTSVDMLASCRAFITAFPSDGVDATITQEMTGLLLVGHCPTLIIDTLQNMHRKAILTCFLKKTVMIIYANTTVYWETFTSVLFSPLSTTLELNTIVFRQIG